MNIGVDIRPLMTKNRTGVGEYTFELLSAIFALDQNNQYFLFYNSFGDAWKNIPKWKQNNVHHVRCRQPNKIFNVGQKLINQPKIDNIINRSIAASQNPDTKNLDVFFSPNLNFTAISSRLKYLLTIHDLSFEIFPEFFSLKQRLWHQAVNPKKQCERADIILTPSENTKRDIVNFYKIKPEKIKVIYPGLSPLFNKKIPDEKIKEVKYKYHLPEKYILFLGTVELRKNIIGLIKSFEQAPSRLPARYHLIIAGAPGYRCTDILNFCAQSPAKEFIKFVGYVPADDKPALYALADLLVYPSFYEGFGFPVLEAMASGTPVIAANRTSLIEITGSSAYLVNPNKPAQISDAIVNILNSDELRKKQIKNGLIRAAEFSWQKAAREFLLIVSGN